MKILWKRGEIAPKEQFLLFSTIFYCLLVDLCVKTGTRFSLRDKRLFKISKFEITVVDCSFKIRFLFRCNLYKTFNLEIEKHSSEQDAFQPQNTGPSCSKLMMSLINISLKL